MSIGERLEKTMRRNYLNWASIRIQVHETSYLEKTVGGGGSMMLWIMQALYHRCLQHFPWPVHGRRTVMLAAGRPEIPFQTKLFRMCIRIDTVSGEYELRSFGYA